MSSKEAKKFLIVGIGNPLRSDDAVGSYVINKIRKKQLSGIKTLVTQQLNIELLEEAVEFEKILLIDADCSDEGLTFRKIQAKDEQPISSSHHLSPELFLLLAKKIYGKDLDLYLCSIGGENFELGEQCSLKVSLLANKAIVEVCAFLKGK